MTFGEFLKQERSKRFLTQEQMAEKIGISSYWYKELEHDKKRPGYNVVHAVSKFTRTGIRTIYNMLKNQEEN